MRPSFRHPQRPPLRRRVQRPLLPSRRHPFIEPQQHLIPVLHLHPERHPALASQQPPFRLPQQLPVRSPTQAEVRPRHRPMHLYPLPALHRRSRRPSLQANQQPPRRLLQQPSALRPSRSPLDSLPTTATCQPAARSGRPRSISNLGSKMPLTSCPSSPIIRLGMGMNPPTCTCVKLGSRLECSLFFHLDLQQVSVCGLSLVGYLLLTPRSRPSIMQYDLAGCHPRQGASATIGALQARRRSEHTAGRSGDGSRGSTAEPQRGSRRLSR
jgi:hypothetical protein